MPTFAGEQPKSSSRMTHFPLRATAAVGCLIAAACSSSTPAIGPDENICITVRGEGQTSGDRHKLRGDAVFSLDGVEQDVTVGLYLFEMREGEGGIHVATHYQFDWESGDSFLTSDDVFLEPLLEPDQYRFNVRMRIISGSGIFAGKEGEAPISLDATIRFGPPRNPGDARSAEEQFTVSGKVCG